MADTHPVRTRVVGSLIVIVVVSLIAYFIPGGWRWVFDRVRDVFIWLGSSSSISTWLLILLCLLSLAFVVIVAVLLFAARKSDHEIDFTETVLFGIRWRWRYGQHGIYNLAAFCPDCDLQVHARPSVSLDDYGGKSIVLYHCDDCNRELQKFDGTYSEVEDRVTRKIQQTLRERLRKRDEHTG